MFAATLLQSVCSSACNSNMMKRLKIIAISFNFRPYNKHSLESYVAKEAAMAENEHSLLQEAVGPGINCSTHPSPAFNVLHLLSTFNLRRHASTLFKMLQLPF